MRALERHGLDPGWATLSQFLGPILVLAPIAIYRWWQGQPIGTGQVLTGFIMGAAVTLYYQSILLTDVVRALILFYMTPTWSTLLERIVLKRQLSLWRGLALLLGFSGLIVILGLEGGIPLPRNLGDGMALTSGILFAWGTLRIRLRPQVSAFEQMFGLFFYGTLIAAALLLLPFAELGSAPPGEVIIRLFPWLVLMAVFFLIPTMFGILWGSGYIDPGRLGILLQMEAVVGIGSAALFAGETYGIREAIGTALVMGAGVVEIIGPKIHNID